MRKEGNNIEVSQIFFISGEKQTVALNQLRTDSCILLSFSTNTKCQSVRQANTLNRTIFRIKRIFSSQNFLYNHSLYSMYLEEEDLRLQLKEVSIIINGHPESVYNLQYKPFLTEAQIQNSFQNKWKFKLRKMRLFNQEGVELNNEELKYLKNQQNIYVSKGEDFDSKSSFSQYKVIKLLGEGGFGKVSLAEHRLTREQVAIKVMKVSSFVNTEQIDLVFRQAESLQALHHPNIVQIFRYYTLKDMQVIVVMEYLEGGELLARLKEKERFEQSEAKIYFKQIIKAIMYVHSKNIIHRDLKLENILLKGKDSKQVKIADFGISGVAKHLNPHASSGTLKYMSPEVLSGSQKGNTPGVDIWALGVILYYMLIGKQPFGGNTNASIISQIVSGKYTIPFNMISIEAQELISRMLDINPETRIKAHEVRDHPWLNTSTIQILTQDVNEHLQNIRSLQTKKQIAAQNMGQTQNKWTPRLQDKKSRRMISFHSASKALKENNNDTKFPKLLNKPILKSKSIMKRGSTTQKKKISQLVTVKTLHKVGE